MDLGDWEMVKGKGYGIVGFIGKIKGQTNPPAFSNPSLVLNLVITDPTYRTSPPKGTRPAHNATTPKHPELEHPEPRPSDLARCSVHFVRIEGR